jgi:hypothetical protein
MKYENFEDVPKGIFLDKAGRIDIVNRHRVYCLMDTLFANYPDWKTTEAGIQDDEWSDCSHYVDLVEYLMPTEFLEIV